MKHPFNFSVFLAALALGVTVMFNPAMQVLAQQATESVKEHAMQHTDPTFACPMHTDVRSDEPGSCPICGMHLVQVEPQQATETVEEHAMQHTDPTYVCPMHIDVRSDEPGSCPICGMHLVQEQAASSHDDEHAADGEKQ